MDICQSKQDARKQGVQLELQLPMRLIIGLTLRWRSLKLAVLDRGMASSSQQPQALLTVQIMEMA